MTVNQNTFTGEFAYSIDAKGRVNIPAKFRQVLSADNEQTFVVTKGLDPCVWVYPAIIWKSIEDGLKHLSSISATNRAFIRNTVRYASAVQYDKQGRIPVTPFLIKHAQLDKEVVIIGMVNKIEIWNPATLNQFERQAQDIDPETYDDLANQIIL
ncbi:MAG: division/cell wall cluster transcriptional repressor MraZ [Fidelibacterota bacterium]